MLEPVPAGSGFTEPGRYITLTTCTPEFTSTYRLIVWGKMVEERPRSKGKPDALVRWLTQATREDRGRHRTEQRDDRPPTGRAAGGDASRPPSA